MVLATSLALKVEQICHKLRDKHIDMDCKLQCRRARESLEVIQANVLMSQNRKLRPAIPSYWPRCPAAEQGAQGFLPGSYSSHFSYKPPFASEREWNDSIILQQTESNEGNKMGGKNKLKQRGKDGKDREWKKLQEGLPVCPYLSLSSSLSAWSCSLL